MTRLTLGTAATLLATLSTIQLAEAQQAGTAIAQSNAPYVVLDRTLPGSGTSWELQLVLTQDELYVPIGVRKPDGDGPFPLILVGSGQGRDGMLKIEQAMEDVEELMNHLVARGYATAYLNFRNEVPELYNEIARSELLADTVSGGDRRLQSYPTLDSEDYVSIVNHVKALPYTDPEAIGAIGSSHSGEIILKGTAIMNIAAGVVSEAAALEYLAIDVQAASLNAAGERDFNDIENARRLADKEVAMSRIRKSETPLLVLGREHDHLQGVFQLAYEWLSEAGRDVQYASFDHPEHGYSLLRQRPGGPPKPDDVQNEVFDLYMAFFEEQLKN
ncbi:MAG: alpha/beta hydrolase family protein [Candidatus Rariloculaceae bacterium]